MLDIIKKALDGTLIQYHRSHPVVYAQIVAITDWLPLTAAPLERAYCILHQIEQPVKCPYCDLHVKWAPTKKAYSPTCGSKECRYQSAGEKSAKRAAGRSAEDKRAIESKRQASIVEKYGSERAYLDELKQKREVTMNAKYGVHCSLASPDVREKIKNTNIQRYGAENVLAAREVRQRVEVTNLARYGSAWHQQSEQGKKQREQTNIANHGAAFPLQTEHIRNKAKHTLVERFGTSTLAYVNREKRIASIRQKYGVDNVQQKHIPTAVLSLLDDKQWLIDQHYNQQKTLVTIAAELSVDPKTVGNRFKQHEIEAKRFGSSTGERELSDWLGSLGVDVLLRNRKIITPYELDIVLPDQRVAIEYCGLYWHSDIHPRMGKSYHVDKLNKCIDAGYRLITIYEDEWMLNRDIVKSKLATILGLCTTRPVYARACTIQEVSTDDAQAFFNATHIQGSGRGSIRYGLYHNDQLVALMAFINEGDGMYQLNRFSTTGRVVGGFSKLLAHFKRSHQWKTILSYADRRWSEGGVYEASGFTQTSITKPSYWYLSKDKSRRIHRSHFRHEKLPLMLSSYDPSATEFANCDANGVLRVWDCGLIRYEMCNNT